MTAGGLRVALVIPARDEARLLPGVLEGLPGWVWRVVLVDDGSRDATPRIIDAWDDPRAVRVRHRRARGVGAAILAGYARALEAGADAVGVVAADGQMAFSELERVIEPVRSGAADYVQGSRFDRGRPRGRMPAARRRGNRILSAATSWASGRRVSDSQCGYTAASAAFLARLDPARLPDGYGFPAFLRIEAHRMGARVAEVPVSARYGDEVSGIHPLTDPPRILARILWRGLARRAGAARGPLAAPAFRARRSGEAG
jgi:glycosyltransferase involved in cell wall biosynthesis